LEARVSVESQVGANPRKSLAERYEALSRVSRAVGEYRDPKELFGVLVGELRHAVDFDFVGMFLYDEATHTFENPVLETVHGPGFVIPRDFPPEETITCWIYHHQQPVVIPCRDEEKRFPRMMELYSKFGVQAACLLPLTTVRRELGSGPIPASKVHPCARGPFIHILER
jgi:formate hydrogenlyase transcriptional activator